MNRSAPVHAQDAPSAIEAAQAEAPASRSGPRAGSVVAAVLALAFLGYIAIWATTALQLRNGVLDWIEARQAEGYRIAHGTVGIGGFPRIARVNVSAPVIAAPDGRALGWSWAGERATIEANPLNPDAVTLRLAGEEAFSINVDGKLRTYRGGADELTLHAHGGRSPRSTSLTVRNLAMAAEEPGDAIEVERLIASGNALERVPQGEPAPAYAIRIEGTGIRLPRQVDLPLGNTVAHLGSDAVVTGPFPTKGDLPEGLARWRDGGGTMEVNRLSLSYGPLQLEGSGTASLDAVLQPAGSFVARIQGFQQTVSTLAGRGLVDERTAANAAIALSILGQPKADGAQPTLSVPLSLHERRLSIGPLPLMVVPMIEWPRGPSPRTGDLTPPPAAAMG